MGPQGGPNHVLYLIVLYVVVLYVVLYTVLYTPRPAAASTTRGAADDGTLL